MGKFQKYLAKLRKLSINTPTDSHSYSLSGSTFHSVTFGRFDLYAV